MGIACLKGASLTITARCFIMEPLWCWSKSGPRSLKVCTKYTHTHTASAPTDMEGEWNASNGKYPLSLSNKLLKPSTISWMNSTMYCWNLYFSNAHQWNKSRDSTRLRISDFLFSVHPARARRACALRGLGLLLADGAPTVGRGKTFWRVNRIFLRKQL